MTSTALPRVSVLMPVHNGQTHLAQAVESILAQSFTDFEFLVIDDGSSDGTAAMMQDYAARDARIRFVSQPNAGITPTLNRLIDMARAPLLARMDADDIAHPERFARQVAYLDAHPDIVALGSSCKIIDDAGRPIYILSLPTTHAEIDDQNIHGKTSMAHPSVMMRADPVRTVGKYNTSYTYAQDLGLWLRLGEIGKLANLPEPLLQYRFTQAGISSSKGAQQYGFLCKAVEAARVRRELPSIELDHGHWRAGNDRKSRQEFALKWAWQAWGSGNQATARHYFWQAVRLRPWSVAALKGLVFGSLRRPPRGV